ncbi:MAG: hypothetical protein QGI21_02375 [Candidatus Poseidoniaceae archaeon]|nr:hypothetical protein [Candidatus Poseidoniaceae archaeon]
MGKSWAYLCSRDEASDAYAKLKNEGNLNLNFKPMPYEDGIAIPIMNGNIELEFEEILRSDPHIRLKKLLNNPPKKWEIIGDLVIFPQDSFSESETRNWEQIASALGCNRVAIQAEIEPGIMRESRLKLVYGIDGWVVHRENFVEYEFDATKVMFSSGNITERRRMGGLNMSNEVVIDAYSGIGYYTIPMIKSAGAKHVHACEINPNSVEALNKGLRRNDLTNQCTIHEGDNRKTMKNLYGIADRVILGLIPSSQPTWGLAIKCIKPEGGIIHIHMNVHENEIEEWVSKTKDWFSIASGRDTSVLNLEKVKWYCPHIRHVVLDLKLEAVN